MNASDEELLARVRELEAALAEIREIWAGAEVGEPVYVREAYAIRLCKQMYKLAVDALPAIDAAPDAAAAPTERTYPACGERRVGQSSVWEHYASILHDRRATRHDYRKVQRRADPDLTPIDPERVDFARRYLIDRRKQECAPPEKKAVATAEKSEIVKCAADSSSQSRGLPDNPVGVGTGEFAIMLDRYHYASGSDERTIARAKLIAYVAELQRKWQLAKGGRAC